MEYDVEFGANRRKAALERALDNRKFEIEMYWKRAAYFWVFIAATFAGYAALEGNPYSYGFLSYLLTCLGLVLSFGWLLANRGSKQWQENWEKHVELLEDDEIGPLFKTTMHRPRPEKFAEWWDNALTGPSRHSVSKINQLLSLYMTLMWLVLAFKAWPASSWKWPISAITVFALLELLFGARTYGEPREQLACLREAKVQEKGGCQGWLLAPLKAWICKRLCKEENPEINDNC